MNRWRNIVIRGLQSGILLGNQDTDSSDDESIIRPLYDDFCSDEGGSCSESEPEPGLGAPIATTSLLVSGSPRAAHSSVFRSPKDTAFRILGVSRSASPKKKRICPKSLVQLVKAENPIIGKAKDLLSDFTPDEIRRAIEQKDTKGNRVIHYACANALVPWVELLIDNKADLNVAGEGGQTPIHFAVKGEDQNFGQVKDRVTVVKLLIKEKVHADKKDYYGRTPLQLACDVKGQHKVIRALLSDTEIDVNQNVKSGKVTSSLFHITCQNDQFENATVLLKHGAKPLAKDSVRGDTPFHIILRKGQVKYALRFLKICEENELDMREILLAQNAYQQCMLREAVKCGDKELVTYCLKRVARADLLKIISKDNSTLMHTACRHGRHDVVKMLDEICPNLLTCPNMRGLTPLHVACSRNQAEVTKVVYDLLQNSHNITCKRRDKDIHIDMEEREGSPSLLKYAAETSAIDCLVVLLKRQKQSTIFELLKWISVERNLFKVLQELLNRSEEIKVSKKQDETKTLTRLCAEKGKTESLLVLVTWNKHIIDNVYDDDDNSLIHLIARKGHLKTTKAILKEMAFQTKKKNKMGQTPLHMAILEDHIMTSELILKTDRGLAGIKDNNGMTPLMYACQTGNIYIVELLLKMLKEDRVEIGFLDCDVKDLNCLDHAIDNRHEMIAVTLLHQDNWRLLMTHASGYGRTKTTPMRKLISSMPGVCKFVMDKCITKVENPSDAKYDEINVDFELLED